MCAGYTTSGDWQRVHPPPTFDVSEFEERFAVRPFDSAQIVRAHERGEPEVITADVWSLIPPFAKDRRLKYSTFNARLDKIADAPTWRTSFPSKRCLVPANGFFERVPEKGEKKKRPYYVQFRDFRPFAFAGLWSEWIDKSTGEALLTFTIITTSNNSLMKAIGHDRMPCIVSPADYEFWLDPDLSDVELLKSLIADPIESDQLQAYPVGHEINYRDLNGPETIEPIGDLVLAD